MLSDVLWLIGAERLALWFLLRSLETNNTIKPCIKLNNSTVPVFNPNDFKVVFEDHDAITSLGDMFPKDIILPEHANDIN